MLCMEKIDLNTATKEDFMKLKGIGSKMADELIRYREEHGGFKTVEDLMNVEHWDEKLYEDYKDAFTVEGSEEEESLLG